MRIRKVEIRNFRSVSQLALDCGRHSTFLGPNNHGKSNLLAALEFALSTASKPAPTDFFQHRKTGDDELWVELTFTELTDQEGRTFEKYLLADGDLCIRKTAQLENGTATIRYNGWLEEPREDWLKADNASDFTKRDAVNETPLAPFVKDSGRLSKADITDAQREYIGSHRDELEFSRTLESGPFMGQKNVAGGLLPDFYLIPAVRDLTDEMKMRASTTFGRLMSRAITEMTQRDPRFVSATEQLGELVSALNDRAPMDERKNELAALEASIERELTAWGVKVNIEVTPPQLEKLFELGTDIHIDDGVKTSAERKGHGLQRAMIFALLRAWANALRSDLEETGGEVSSRKQSTSVIFAMEEPELFLHPHAQRRLANSLREISDAADHQVFLCTHSTHFVDLANYQEISIVSKHDPKIGSTIRQCRNELFEGDDINVRKKRFHMAEWINPDRGEMFFADTVVFVEGETEKAVFPWLAKRLDIFNPEVSVIECGAKHNLPLYVEIAKAFRIRYFVVHDEDPVPDPIPEGWSEDKVASKRRTFALNDSIDAAVEAPCGKVLIFKPDFELATGISRRQGEKKGKALAALDHLDELNDDQLPEELLSVVREVYNRTD